MVAPPGHKTREPSGSHAANKAVPVGFSGLSGGAAFALRSFPGQQGSLLFGRPAIAGDRTVAAQYTVTGVITDDPALLREIMAARELPLPPATSVEP